MLVIEGTINDEIARRVSRAALWVPGIWLTTGLLVGPVEPEVALLASAGVLGWTRLVGL